jgi:autotransporter-associated beta strand protein
MNSFGTSTTSGQNMGFTNSSGVASTLNFTNANNYITIGSNGSKTLTNATANLTVAFTGAVDIGSSTAGDVLFTGPGSFTLNGALNSTGSALRALTKSGDGTLTLNAASGYNGVTTLSLGTIALGANGTLGTNSVVINDGTLAVGTSSSTVKDLTVNSGGITGTGTLTSANNFTFANTTTSTVSANLAGAAAVTQTGSSRVVLSGSNTFSGGLNLNSAGSGVDVTRAAALGTGTITAGSTNSKLGLNTITSLTIANAVNTGSSNTATMAFTPGASGNSMTVSGLISGSGIAKVSGGGDLYLNNSGNTYSGGTEVGTGRIYVGSDGALGATTGAVNFGTTTNSVLAITSNVSFNANRNFTMSAAAYTANIDTGANAVTINGVISPIIGGTGGLLTKLGTGSLTLAGANTYSGATTISSGVLNIRNSAGLGTTANGTTVADLAALELQNGISVGAEALTLNGTGVSSGGALRNISGNNTYGGLLTLGSASRINSDSGTLSLTNAGTVAGAFALTVGGAGDTVLNSILGTSTGTLTKDGTGKFTMGGANTFTGLTTVSGGTLAYGVANALSIGAVTVNGSGAVLDIATFSDTVGAVTLTTGSITGTTGVLTGTSFAMDGTGSASAILAGSGATLTKTGAGTTTTLSGANTYTGTTSVTSGTLAVNGSLLSSGSVVVNAGGFLGGSGSVGAITGAGTVGPGNSPGILTATSVDPTLGTDFQFEITSLSPTYTSATSSGNDLLHLTSNSSPFAGGTFASGNIVSIYLNSSAITASLLAGIDTTFSGAFFVDGTYALASALTPASFAYYTTSAALGTGSAVDYNGTFYYELNSTIAAKTTLSDTTVTSAGFTTGTVAGTLLTFNTVPEPSTGSLLAFGLGGLVLTRLLRRKQS